MDSTTHVAVSLASAMRRALDVTANNIANAGTPGFKAERIALETYASPDGAPSAYVFDAGSYVDLRQGALMTTGNPLDVALAGPGWLAYATPDGRTAYGRDGSLMLDAQGRLVTSSGAQILDDAGAPVVLPPDASPIEIASDGTISTPGGEPIARIGVFDVAAPDALERLGGGLLGAPDGGAQARPAEGTAVVQGAIEGSNVAPVVEMTGLLEIQRAYERATRLIRTHDELARDAIRRAGRTT